MTDKVRENRLRRMAERQGLSLSKSRRRDPHAIDFGGYMLVDTSTNTVVHGSAPVPYSLDLNEIEKWLSDPKSRG
jgi:hypothetical protein